MMGLTRKALGTMGMPVRWLLVSLLAVYRVTLSGLVGGQCRFYPSCSSYAEEAVRRHGAARGICLAAWRLARCGPFSRGGVDPVPPVGTRLAEGLSGRSCP